MATGARRRTGWRTLPLAGRRARSVLRAPLRLTRFPGILAAVLGSTLIIAVAAGASPLFISATGTAAFRERVRATSPFYAGLSLTSTARITPREVADRTDLAESITSRLPVGPASVTITGSQATVTAPASKAQAEVRLVMANGFLSHVQRVAGAGADGVWVPRSVADVLGLEPGGTVTVQLGERRASLRVAGVYRDLGLRPLPPFWTALSSLVYPSDPALPTPPPFLLGEVEPFAHLEAVLRDRGMLRIDYPLQPGLSLSGAETAAEAMPAAISDALSPVNVYDRFQGGWVQGPPLFEDASSGLPSLVQQAEQTVAAATQPVQAISLAGRLVALIMAGAAGVYGIRRRRAEFELLSARGFGPFRLGARNAVEAVLPSAVGAVAGWALALRLVRVLGPGAPADHAAVHSSVVQAGWSVAAGLVLFAVSAGLATRNEAVQRPGRLRDATSRLRWDLAVLALAGASGYEILTRGGGAVQVAGGPPKLDLLILLFPFLFVAGAAGLSVRWLRHLLPGLKAAGGRRSPWMFLSTTRLASAPRLAAALVTISAVALGILVYGGVLESSARATATEKASLAIGSDVSIPAGGVQVVEGHPPFASTTVERFSGVGIYPGAAQADVLAVDPGSFAPAAYWPANLGPPMSGLVSKLSVNGGPLPVVSVGSDLPLGARLVIGGGQEVPVRVVAHVEAFPGAAGSGLTLVADRREVARTFPADLSSLEVGFELWARGDPALILRVLRNLGFGVDLAATAAKARTTPAFLALSWTLGLLQALGILAAGVAALVLVSYLQARQRGREVSYALARRMGLTRSEHRRAVRAELLVMLFAAFVLGSALSTAAAALVNSRLDPVPDLPPNPFLSIPGSLFAVTALSLVLVSVVGARLVQRRADRADVASVMRLSG